MLAPASALRLGSKIKFQDCWSGVLAGLEVDEAWEVTNVLAQHGFLFTRSMVKLPFSLATDWSDDFLAMDCDSHKAFAREVPPVAASARPLSAQTPIGMAGIRLAGLLVLRQDRRATEVLIRQGLASVINRVRVEDTKFEGKNLNVVVQVEKMPSYRPDDELAALIREAITADRLLLTPDEKMSISVSAAGGVVTLRGNVRNGLARERAADLASAVQGVVALQNEIADDIQLETQMGLALERAGLQRTGAVYARSSLGRVVLFGQAQSLRAIDDIMREVSGIPGVRAVQSRLQVSAGAAPVTA